MNRRDTWFVREGDVIEWSIIDKEPGQNRGKYLVCRLLVRLPRGGIGVMEDQMYITPGTLVSGDDYIKSVLSIHARVLIYYHRLDWSYRSGLTDTERFKYTMEYEPNE